MVGIDLLSRDQSAPEGLSHTRHLVNEWWDRQRFCALSGYQSKRKRFLPPSRSIDLFGLFPRAFVKQDLPVFTKTVRNNQPLERFLQRLPGEFLPFALILSRSPQNRCGFGLIYYWPLCSDCRKEMPNERSSSWPTVSWGTWEKTGLWLRKA